MAMWKTKGIVPGTQRRPQEADVIVASARPPGGRVGRARPVRYDADSPGVAFAGRRFWAAWTWRGPNARLARGEYAGSSGSARFAGRGRLAKPVTRLVADEGGILYGESPVAKGWLPGSDEEQVFDVTLSVRAGALPFKAPHRVSRGVLGWSSAVAGRQGLVVAWIEVAGSDSRLLVQRWSASGPRGPAVVVTREPLQVCPGCGEEGQDVTSSPLGLARVAANRRGDVGLVWMVGDNMRATTLRTSGDPNPQILASVSPGDPGYVEPQGLSVDPRGTSTVLWIHGRSGFVNVSRTLYATRISPGRAPEPRVAITRSRGFQDTAVTTTSRGVALIAWTSFDGHFFASSAAPGKPFSRPHLLTSRRLRRGPRASNPDDTYIATATDGRGGAVLTFTIPGPLGADSDQPAYSDVFAVSYTP
jgi:hypothetical protein